MGVQIVVVGRRDDHLAGAVTKPCPPPHGPTGPFRRQGFTLLLREEPLPGVALSPGDESSINELIGAKITTSPSMYWQG